MNLKITPYVKVEHKALELALKKFLSKVKTKYAFVYEGEVYLFDSTIDSERANIVFVACLNKFDERIIVTKPTIILDETHEYIASKLPFLKRVGDSYTA